jgi:hypothetical protein
MVLTEHDEYEIKPRGEAVAEDIERRRRYRDISDGEVFDSVPGSTLRAVHTPGHSSDHCCFVLEEEGAIFAGDCVLNGNTAVFENLSEYSKSLEKMSAELRGAISVSEAFPSAETRPRPGRMYPAHGDVIEDGAKKLEQYSRHRETREGMFFDALEKAWRCTPERGGLSVAELTREVYGNAVNVLVLNTACRRIARQHLQKLTEEGKVLGEERWIASVFAYVETLGVRLLGRALIPKTFLSETRYRPAPGAMTRSRAT